MWIVAGPQEVDLCVPSLSSLMFILGQSFEHRVGSPGSRQFTLQAFLLTPYLDVWLIHASNRHPRRIITGNLCAGKYFENMA